MAVQPDLINYAHIQSHFPGSYTHPVHNDVMKFFDGIFMSSSARFSKSSGRFMGLGREGEGGYLREGCCVENRVRDGNESHRCRIQTYTSQYSLDLQVESVRSCVLCCVRSTHIIDHQPLSMQSSIILQRRLPAMTGVA